MAATPEMANAHRHSIRHRNEVLACEVCGCFYCLRTFAPSEIQNWVLDGPTEADETAMCPYCVIDSVLGSASGFPITDEFLRQMRAHYFESTVLDDPEPAE